MGLIISIIVVGGGLLYILYLSIKGKDVDRKVVYLFVGVTVAFFALAFVYAKSFDRL